MFNRLSVAFLLMVSFAVSQTQLNTIARPVRVTVIMDGTCDLLPHVKLMGVNGSFEEEITNNQCEAEFRNIAEGAYSLTVSGPGLANTSTFVTVSPASTEFEVKVKRAAETGDAEGLPGAAFVSANDLAVPAKARKELMKADEQLEHRDFSKAIQTLNHAIRIYPAYANAYNNLGVIYARLGDRDREREALQKAISLDDHFAPAYLNLGRLDIATNDFRDAEMVLGKAASHGLANSIALVLLAYCEFMDQHFDDAIATSRRAHSMPGSHSSVHLIAAQAFRQKRDRANVIAELEMFLKEEPIGQRADAARKDLVVLEAAR
jgi:Flp pilus assembly protein TadD